MCFQNLICKDNKLEKTECWHLGKWQNQACCLGSTVLIFLHTCMFEGKWEEKFFRWLIFSKEKLCMSPVVAKQFLFPVLQIISAYIRLYLASSIFVPAAPSGNFLPWVIVLLKYKQPSDTHSARTCKVNQIKVWAVFRLSYRSDATVSTTSAAQPLGGH